MPTEDLIAIAVEHHRNGNLDQAEQIYGRILAEEPNHADALHLMGLLAHDRGRHETALAYMGSSIALEPDRAHYHSNLGNALQALGRYSDAVLCYEEALRLDPDLAEAHNNLGNALDLLGRRTPALANLLEAVRLKPDYPDAFSNLGRLLFEAGQYREAADCYLEAARLQPDVPAHGDRAGKALALHANQLRQRGLYEDAMACCRRALAVLPESAELHMCLAHCALVTGSFEEGWREMEWRWKLDSAPAVVFPQPLWDGSPLEGRRILLWSEQGLGDTVQFARYARQVKARGGFVLVECQPGLTALLRSLREIDEVVRFGDPLPPFDVHAPLQSLPNILKTTSETIPPGTAYLSVEAAAAERWRARLAAYGGLRVGLMWEGNPKHPENRNRSIELEALAPLSELPGVSWFALDPAARQPLRLGELPVVALHELGQTWDFADTAAAIACLDLVISVDTSVAHVAGALGKPIWTLLAFAPDYRWLAVGDSTPWYATMRLFRQPAPGDWQAVIASVGAALSAELQRRGVPAPGAC